ncbi:MAG: tetratricopeptide repeat protein [Methanothrix sp.]
MAVGKLWDPQLLQHYTRHGLDHSERIIDVLGLIIGNKNNLLTEEERFVLLASAYLHDVGMQSPEHANLPKKQDYNAEEKEIIRKSHNLASARMINESISQNSQFSLGLEICKDYAHYIAIISKYHRGLDINELAEKSGGKLRMALLAALLQLGDELDADKQRVNIDILKLREIPIESKYHWWGHYYVESISIKDNKIKVWFRFPRTYFGNELVEIMHEKIISSIKSQLSTVCEILFDNGINLFPNIKINDEYYDSGLEQVPDDLHEYIINLVQIAKSRTIEASRETRLQWYVDGVPFSDDPEVSNRLSNILKLAKDERYIETIKEIDTCSSLFMSPKDKMIFLGIAGNCYQSLGELSKAENYYKELLVISGRPNIQAIYNDEAILSTAAALNNIGIVYFIKGDLDKSRECSVKALEIYKKFKDIDMQIAALLNIGNIYRSKGEVDQAIKCFNKGLEIFDPSGNGLMKAAVFSNLGIIFLEKGETENAYLYQKDALEIFRKGNNKEGESSVLGSLARICYIKGDQKGAIDLLEKALEIDREINNKQSEATHLLNIGNIYADKGELNQSLEYRKNALRIFKEIGYKQGEASALANIALICRDKGKLDKALEYHNEAKDIFKMIDFKQGEAEQLINIGNALIDKGKLSDALSCIISSLKISRNIKYKQNEAFSLTSLAEFCIKKGDFNSALKYHTKSLDIFKKIMFKEGEAQCLCSIGLVYYEKDDLDKALDYLNKGLHIFEKIGVKKKVAIQLGHIGLIYKKKYKMDHALESFKDALRIERVIGYRVGEAKQLNNIADLCIFEGNYKLAIQYLSQALSILDDNDSEIRNIIVHNILYAICRINIYKILN